MEGNSTSAVVPTTLSRRRLLRASAAGASVFAGLGTGPLISRRARAAAFPVTPDEAIAELMNGNQRYVDGNLTSFRVDLEELRMKTQEKQMPFAAVLSCADSRVPVELVFDQSIGRLFVARVAGNITTPEIFASLEYGAEALAVKAILVLAHTNCGAVQAAILGKEPGGQITALYPHIQPAIPLPPTTPNPDAVALVNAQNQAELLRDASPLLKGLVDQGDLKIASGIYAVKTGVVKFDT